MEQRVLDIVPDAVMLRAEWMYDYYPKRANYLMQILNATGPVRFSSRQ
jgi:dTDP-4-dehydrorhamnose reductase